MLDSQVRSPRTGHVDALDGLRAVAAIAVLVLHVSDMTGMLNQESLFWRVMAHGGVGVPIFFVLSGLLLFRPWVRSALTGSEAPSVNAFYWKRGLRILPTYWVVMIVAFVCLDHEHLGSVRRWVELPTLTYVYDPTWSGKAPPGLGPTWSLCTEVSFYLLLPFLAWALCRFARRGPTAPRLLYGLGAVMAFSLLWTFFVRVFAPIDFQFFNENLLPRWLLCFALGMALAVLCEESDRTEGAIRRWTTMIGAVPGVCWLVAAVALVLVSTPLATPLPGIPHQTVIQYLVRTTLYAVVAVALVAPVAFRPDHPFTRQVLGNRPMAWLGSISYGIFLWHRIFLDGWYALTGRSIWQGDFLLVLTITVTGTLIAAPLSRHLIELPAQRFKNLVR
jgi:peptidoglycan/LPS O-acetylase OafA/YrhL